MTQSFIQTIWTVANKEMRIHFKTKRLLVIGIIFLAVFIIFSIWGGYLTSSDQDEPSYEEGAENVMIMVLAFSSFFPPILAIALTYDSIVGERVNNSMYLLISKPVKKEAIYLGKFLGAWISIAMVYIGVMTIGYLIVIGLSGQIPSGMDVVMIYIAVFYILLGVAAWISLFMLFSTTFKTIASTLITAVLMWLFVLSLVSQAGLIYWMVTAPEPDYEISVDINMNYFGSNQSTVSASGFKLTQDPGEIDLVLRDAGGSEVGAAIPGSIPKESTILVNPGEYSWEVTNGLTGSDKIIYESGVISVSPNTKLTSEITRQDDDLYYNDYRFYMTDANNNVLAGGHYELSRNGEVLESGDFGLRAIAFQNLSEGWYDFQFSYNGDVLFEDSVYSYGETTPQIPGLFSFPDEEPPGYVKFMLLFNPDNAIGGYAYFLNEDYDGLLSLGESTAALVVFLAVCGTSGIVLFKKKDLV